MGLTGMFWFDNQGGKSIIEKIRGAINGHRKRFGRMPELCLINQNQFALLNSDEVEGVPVRIWERCLDHHFVVGWDNPQPAPRDTPE